MANLVLDIGHNSRYQSDKYTNQHIIYFLQGYTIKITILNNK